MGLVNYIGMSFRDVCGRVLVKLVEDVNEVFVNVDTEAFIGIREENLFAEFVLPAVYVLNEFFGEWEVVIPVKSWDVGGGLKKDVDKATIGSFNIRGVKMSVDFKGSVITEVNVEAVEFHAEAFMWIDKVSFFAGSITFGGRAIVSVRILIVFRRAFGAVGFGDLNLSVRIESEFIAFVGNVRGNDTAFPVAAKSSERDSAYIDDSA